MADTQSARDLPGAIGSALLAAAGVAALWYSSEFSPLGAVFPRTIGGLMVALGVVYIVLTLMGRTRRAAQPGGSHVRRAGVVVAMLGWAFLLEPLGFLGSSALAFVALLLVANHARWTPRTALGYGVAGALVLVGLYALFKMALLVPLP